eukprot:4989596-Prymnesium_polylepis.1
MNAELVRLCHQRCIPSSRDVLTRDCEIVTGNGRCEYLVHACVSSPSHVPSVSRNRFTVACTRAAKSACSLRPPLLTLVRAKSPRAT